MTFSGFPRHRDVVVLGTIMLLATACGPSGDGRPDDDLLVCREPTAERLAGAGVERYIAQRDPKPVRFLNPVSTDSAMPASGMAYLNSAGPTYLFPPDTTQQAIVRGRLAEVGSWPTLLVFFHGVERLGEDEAEIRFSGQYIGGEADGQATPREAVRFTCSSGQWVLPAVPTADTAAVPVQRGA